jgi:hypothetical protein
MEQTPRLGTKLLELSSRSGLVTREEYEIAGREVARFRARFQAKNTHDGRGRR